MDKNRQKYKYLYLLSEKYPNRQSVVTELIRLKAILNLARPTEHFMSDLHGEYESFFHILNNTLRRKLFSVNSYILYGFSHGFLYKNVKTDFCIKVSLRHLSFTILCIFYPFPPIIVHFSKKEYRILQ